MPSKLAGNDRYNTPAVAIVRVRCGCGHFDTIGVRPGEHVTIDGIFEKCEMCQAQPITDEAIQDRKDLG